MTVIRPETIKAHLLFFLILAGAALLRLYMVTLDINILLDQGLAQDDAFYYYVIAHNILEHGHSSFDNIHATNGYHPLWQALCLPIFYYFKGDVAVRVMLAIASFFDIAALVIFYKILVRVLKNNYVALTGLAILAFHGTIIRTWFNGLETALSIFALTWLLQQFLVIKTNNTNSLKPHIWFGFIAAIAFLSRTDNAIVIVVIFLFLYLPPLFTKRAFKHGLVASLVFLALVSPWLIWNLTNYGSIIQISGQIRDNVWLIDGTPVEMPLHQQVAYGIFRSFEPIRIVFEKMFTPGLSSFISGYIYFFLFLAGLVYAWAKSPALPKNVALFFPFIAGVVILFLYHAGVRHFVRGWYNAPVLLTLTLLFCLLVDTLDINRFARLHKVLFFIAVAALLIFYSPYRYTKVPADLHPDDRVAVANWLRLNTTPHALIGAANAGIMGYYSDRRVVNLDGVVNESAFRARINNQLQAYIRDSQIDYLADHKGSITHLCKDNPYFRCKPTDSPAGTTLVMAIDR